MDELFGISMNYIMLGLLGLLGISLASVGYVVLRNRIMFLMGLRNMPRRLAQTVLIVIGLMLSTLIISAAFTTGDTVDFSLTNETYTLLGHTDEVVQRRGETDEAPNERHSTIPQEVNDTLRAALEAAADPNIDGYLPLLFQQVPVLNPETRLSEPSATFVGLDADSLDGFPDFISSTTGEALDVGSLAADEAFMNESAADELATEPGARVQVFAQGQRHPFTIVDVIEDRFVTGVGAFEAREGLVTRLDTLQEIVGRPGEVSFIAISNRGGVRDSVDLSGEVVSSLERIIAAEGLALEVESTKQDLVDNAEEAGNIFATFFLVFGLFSIGAGMLLIVMIFVMLATERKPEMGMARAVGTKRGHLIQMFLSEGMAYNLLSAMVGAGLGILVAFGMAEIMTRIFSEFGLNIQPHVTLRTVAISYSLGVVLTFLTVVFSSWRVSKLNIVRAIRDIPEPRGGRMGWRWLVTGLVSIGLGVLLFLTGMSSDLAFPFALGFSMILLGAAIVLRFLRLPERPVVTATGVFVLLFWGLTAGNRLEWLVGELEGDVEMFFLSGIAMVTASTFVLMYNADLALAVLSRLGGVFGPILPAMKTAVAYPLANKLRTGMTIAMISLVVFALTMMSSMNLNFDRLFLADTARGGWDVIVDENPNNPIDDLPAALAAAGSNAPDGFRAVGRVSLDTTARVSEDRRLHFNDYSVSGVDEGFVDGGEIPLSARARGFESDEAVWEAMKTERNVAIVDGFTVQGGGLFADETFSISGIDADASEFESILLYLFDPISEELDSVRVIGVIDFGASATFFGIYVPERMFTRVFGEPDVSRHFVGLLDPGDSKAVAQEIEGRLLSAGVQAESLKERVEDDQALSRNFFRLMQGFMGLGLVVGIAAVGVIAFRTVVERRQQIGMLRAIGYKRSTVALSFMLESSFITLLSIVSGVGLALWLSYFLITSDEFPSDLGGYFIPWDQIIFIAAFTYGASLLMSFIPSRQAASVPTAEALRYE